MVRLNLSSDDVRNCKETTTFVKECKKIIECKKKGILNLKNNQGFLFEKSKQPDKFREMYKKMEQVKLRKVSKTQSSNKVKQFYDVEICQNYYNVWIRPV